MQIQQPLIRHILLLTILLWGYQSNTYAGNPWVKAKNSGYFQLGLTYISANSIFKNGTDSVTLRRNVRDITLQAYAEYGLTNNITLIVSLPFKMTGTGDDTFTSSLAILNGELLNAGTLNSLGNAEIGIKYGFLTEGPLVATAQLNIGLPTGSFDEETGLQTGYDAFAIAPSVMVGYGAKSFFASAELGVNLRNNEYSSEFFTSIEVGANIKNKFFPILVLSVRQSFENGEYDDGKAVHTSLYVNDQEYFSPGLKLLYNITNSLGISLSAIGAGSGNSVARFPALGGAVYYKW